MHPFYHGVLKPSLLCTLCLHTAHLDAMLSLAALQPRLHRSIHLRLGKEIIVVALCCAELDVRGVMTAESLCHTSLLCIVCIHIIYSVLAD